MSEKLTCEQARRMDLVHYLETLGHTPQRIHHSDYWYRSPLRSERNPSFKVDRRLNLWYDHGLGKGGTLIDFGLLYFHCSVAELLARLSQANPLSPARPSTPIPSQEREGKILVTSVSDITSTSLLQYLASRHIEPPLAARYLRQVQFTLYNKAHLALGFPNNSGGFELRNAYFKGSSSPKDCTLLHPGHPTVSVFEGFFSFLSYLQLHEKRKEPITSFLVLNSLALLKRATPLMQQHGSVHLYLDRDAAGRKATRVLLAAGAPYRDRSRCYHRYKDLNDWLRAGPQRSAPSVGRRQHP